MIDTLPDPNLEAVAEVLRTLGHDTRLRLIATLLAQGETSAGEIEVREDPLGWQCSMQGDHGVRTC